MDRHRQMEIVDALVVATLGRKVVVLDYDGSVRGERIFYPHVLYEAANGALLLDGVQVAGPSTKGNPVPGWRALHIDQIRGVRILDREFKISRRLNLRAPKYRKVFAQVSAA